MPSTTPSRTELPAAASALTAGLLGGPPAEATVLGVHGPALYLDVAGRVLPVVTADAVPLPTALRLTVRAGEVPGVAGAPRDAAWGVAATPGDAPWGVAATPGDAAWGVAVGDPVVVGLGRVELPGADLVVARTWRPARVRRLPRSGVGCSGGRPGSHLGTRPGEDHVRTSLLAHATAGADGWLVDGIRTVLTRLECGSGCRGSRFRTRAGIGGVEDAVAALVGRGPGLTPSGDDALAGALLVLHAHRAAGPLAAAVRARLGSTTAVSAALLDAAADGFAARDVVTLVDAALAGDDATVAAVLPAVLAIGHSSGRDLATGVLGALTVVGATLTVVGRVDHVDPPLGPTPALTPTGRSAA